MTEAQLHRAEQIALLAQPMFASMWNAMWPTGCCVPASLILAPILRASVDKSFRVALGTQHVWCECDGNIVDPTYGQFTKLLDTPLLVIHKDDYRPDKLTNPRILTLEEEEKYRRRITTRGQDDEWFPCGVGIREDYWGV